MCKFAWIEFWKGIPEYEGYESSNTGRIRSWRHKNGQRKRPFVLKPRKLKRGGRHAVTLYGDFGRLQTFVSRLVLFAWDGPCPKGMECRHLDGNVDNNYRNNLKWGTKEENAQDKKRHGTARNQYSK